MKKLAIIGAGLSGLVLAHILQKKTQSLEITLFEKSRGVSGRLTTRYTQMHEFDHGAPYFTARSEAFKQFLDPYIKNKIIAPWHAKSVTFAPHSKNYKRLWFEPHYISMPRANTLCKTLAKKLDVHLNARVAGMQLEQNKWTIALEDASKHTGYNWVISTVPCHQATSILPDDFFGQTQIQQCIMHPQYTLMLGLDPTHPPFHFDIATLHNSPLETIIINSHKPQRTQQPSLVAHSTSSWAKKHLEDDSEHVGQAMYKILCQQIALMPNKITHTACHKWRYAKTEKPAAQPYFLDAEKQLAACGDWCLGSRAEDAFTSAYKLSDALQAHLHA